MTNLGSNRRIASALTAHQLPLRTVADLLEHLGDLPPERVRLRPPPGTATEEHVLEIEQREDRLCELVDGVLVEKAMGYRESVLAAHLLALLQRFVQKRNLGLVSGEGGFLRLFTGLVRIPDVAFASWERLPGGAVPNAPVPELAPDLVVEVLRKGNTPAEMARKRGEYFAAGVRLIWIVDPEARTVSVYTSPEELKILREEGTLDGGAVLPGFELALKDLFSELDRRGP